MEREGNGEGVRLRSRVLAVDAALVQDKARSLAFELGKGSQASSGTGKRNLHLVRCSTCKLPVFACGMNAAVSFDHIHCKEE